MAATHKDTVEQVSEQVETVFRTTATEFVECDKCGSSWTRGDEAPEGDCAHESTTTRVTIPTVGRVVHVNIAPYSADPVLRPGLVVASQPLGLEDAVTVAVFLCGDDFPLPGGLNVRQPEVGTPAYPAKAGWQIECCRYGTGSGCWVWPEHAKPQTFTIE